jgi:diacylglycerol kinase (ATP)
MIRFIKSRIRSFQNAFAGWGYVIHTQKNAWIHLLATICVILLGIWLKISLLNWSILVLTITTVWIAEFLNSSLEVIVDLASPQFHPLAKIGKDVAAAAVLIAAISSILIGIMVFWTPLSLRVAEIFK